MLLAKAFTNEFFGAGFEMRDLLSVLDRGCIVHILLLVNRRIVIVTHFACLNRLL